MKTPIAAYHSDENYRDLVFIKAYVIDKCNYNCSYCYNRLPRTSNQLDLAEFEKFIRKAHQATQRHIFLELIGGEPTLHSKLFSFCKKMDANPFVECIYIYSNFSANIEEYAKLLQLNNVHFDLTWHSIGNINRDFYFKAKHLIEVAQQHNKTGHVAFNVMLEHSNINSAMMMHKMLKKLTSTVDLSLVGSLSKINSTNRYDYDDVSYKLFIDSLQARKYDSEICIEYDDKSTKLFSINEMMNHVDKRHISFYNWRCNAGIDRFYVHYDNGIWPCQEEFENGFQPIGSIIGTNGQLFKRQPISCRCEACICEGFIKKHAN